MAISEQHVVLNLKLEGAPVEGRGSGAAQRPPASGSSVQSYLDLINLSKTCDLQRCKKHIFVLGTAVNYNCNRSIYQQNSSFH